MSLHGDDDGGDSENGMVVAAMIAVMAFIAVTAAVVVVAVSLGDIEIFGSINRKIIASSRTGAACRLRPLSFQCNFGVL